MLCGCCCQCVGLGGRKLFTVYSLHVCRCVQQVCVTRYHTGFDLGLVLPKSTICVFTFLSFFITNCCTPAAVVNTLTSLPLFRFLFSVSLNLSQSLFISAFISVFCEMGHFLWCSSLSLLSCTCMPMQSVC